MKKRQKKQSTPKKIERSEMDRRRICAFDYFFNPDMERRKNIKDRRYERNSSKGNLSTIFLG